jgi:hypothetical protein
MIRHIFKQPADGISMMTGDPFNTPDTILFNEMFADLDNL